MPNKISNIIRFERKESTGVVNRKKFQLFGGVGVTAIDCNKLITIYSVIGDLTLVRITGNLNCNHADKPPVYILSEINIIGYSRCIKSTKFN